MPKILIAACSLIRRRGILIQSPRKLPIAGMVKNLPLWGEDETEISVDRLFIEADMLRGTNEVGKFRNAVWRMEFHLPCMLHSLVG